MNRKNIVSERITLTLDNSTTFDLELRNNLIVVEGLSGQGKTLFFKTLRNEKFSGISSNVEGVDLESVYFIDIFANDLIDLKLFLQSKTGKLIIIDNADSILTREIAEYIGWDNKNQYIIFSRASWPFGLSPNYFARMVNKNGNRVLEYEYEEKGWN